MEFKSDGRNSFGQESGIRVKTMTWNYVDFTNNETRGEIIEAFSSDKTIHVNVVIKDKKGDNLLRITSKANKI